MPIWSKLSFQNSNSPLMENLEFFHDHTFLVLTGITFSILILMVSFVWSEKQNRFFNESQDLELFWTAVPAVLLSFIAFPSLKILYLTDDFLESNVTLNILGSQWYWSYEILESGEDPMESYMAKEMFPRNLNTSNNILLPIKTPFRNLISSSDVLHSWAIPSLGVKADATPGRINQIFSNISKHGLYVGQCSEICGMNHSFMPISISTSSGL